MSFLIKINVTGDFSEEQEEEYLDTVLEYGAESTYTSVKYTMIDEEIMEKINKWKKLSFLKNNADDHTRCPECKEQLYFCDCVCILADEILLELEKEKFI